MKKLLIPIIILTVFACEKKNNNPVFDYAYKITRSFYINDNFEDSLVYYYNTDNKLLRVDKCYAPFSCSEHYVTYSEDEIGSWNGTYHFNNEGRIDYYINVADVTDFYYEDNLLVSQQRRVNNFIAEENFFTYENSDMIKDLTVFHHEDDPENYITEYNYTYTDTLKPDFMVDYSGLFEFPSKSKYLTKTAEAPEHGILYLYAYKISQNKIVEYSQFIDTFNDELGEIVTTTYTYEGK